MKAYHRVVAALSLLTFDNKRNILFVLSLFIKVVIISKCYKSSENILFNVLTLFKPENLDLAPKYIQFIPFQDSNTVFNL